MMTKSVRRAMREGLAMLRAIENERWSLRAECDGCALCKQKEELRTKATAAMKRLEKELSREVA